MFYVYQITNTINDKKYFGKAADPTTRWDKHKNVAERKDPNQMFALHYAIVKYGIENFEFRILFGFETEQASLDKEVEMIAEHKTNISKHGSIFGYNMTDGGEGTSGYKPTEEQRAHMSEMMMGRTFSEEAIEKMRQAKLGITLTEEHKQKIGAAGMDRKLDEATIEKISASQAGENNHQSKLTKEKVREIKIMIANDKSSSIIARTYNVSRKTICDIKHGKCWANVETTPEDVANTTIILAKLGDTQNKIKLNKEKADEIKVLLKDGVDAKVIATRFGVSSSTIKDIAKGRYWKDVEPDKITNSKLDSEKVSEIKKLLQENKLSYSQIARQFDVEPGTINKIRRGTIWKDVV